MSVYSFDTANNRLLNRLIDWEPSRKIISHRDRFKLRARKSTRNLSGQTERCVCAAIKAVIYGRSMWHQGYYVCFRHSSFCVEPFDSFCLSLVEHSAQRKDREGGEIAINRRASSNKALNPSAASIPIAINLSWACLRKKLMDNELLRACFDVRELFFFESFCVLQSVYTR